MKNPGNLLTVFAPLLSAALGCTGTDGPAGGREWRASVDTLGDTIVVRTVAGSVWGDTATLVPEVTIGMLDGPDEYIFGSVRAIAVAGDGTIYVSDGQVPAVRAYAPDGTYLRTLGNEGGGPGEYKSLDGGLAVLSDGRIVVRDPGNGRFNVFAPDGESLDSWRHPSGGGFSTGARLHRDPQDRLYTTVIMNLGVDVTEWKRGFARIGPDGAVLDTVEAPTWDFDRPIVSGRSENSSSSTPVPFSPDVEYALMPEGYFVGGVSTDYRFDLLRSGAPVLRIERDWIPVPVHPEEAEESRERIVENFQRNFEGWRWNGDPIPDTKPPFRTLFTGDNGWIWVQVSQPGEPFMSEAEAREEERVSGRKQLRYRERVAFDVFNADGEFLGHVATPEGFSVSPAPVFRETAVWATTRDELGVTRVVRYRISLADTT